jgi:hypothetical protein
MDPISLKTKNKDTEEHFRGGAEEKLFNPSRKKKAE